MINFRALWWVQPGRGRGWDLDWNFGGLLRGGWRGSVERDRQYKGALFKTGHIFLRTLQIENRTVTTQI